METKTGYIVKGIFNGQTIYNHLLFEELYLITQIAEAADNKEVQLKRVTYQSEDDFIVMKF